MHVVQRTPHSDGQVKGLHSEVQPRLTAYLSCWHTCGRQKTLDDETGPQEHEEEEARLWN